MIKSLKASVKQNTILRLRVTLSDISNTRKSVSLDIQTLRGGLKKQGAVEVSLAYFKVFGYLMKHSFECLI